MRPEPSQYIDHRAVLLWRLQALINTGFSALLATAVAIAVISLLEVSGYWYLAALGLIAVNATLRIAVFPVVRWRLWRFELTPHELDMQSGLLIVRRTLVPLVRVQHVDTVQGPLSKLLGLSAVTVYTAASVHEIPALSDAVAADLRDKISVLAREARDSV